MRRSSWTSRLGGWGRAGIAALAIAVATSAARAQFGGRGGADFRTAINDGEIDRMVATFQLDDSQISLVDALYDGFRDAYEAASDESRQRVRDAFQEMRDSGDWQSAASTGITFAREWQAQGKALEQSFFGDVKAVLTEDQLKLWPGYERDWRRRSSLRGGGQVGALAGENIDLFELVEELELDETAQTNLSPILDAYAIELDPALTNRDRAVSDMTDLTSSVLEGKTDIEQLDSKFKNLQRLRAQVRDVNDRYVQVLASSLDPDKARALELEYRQRCFRRIYSPTQADRYIETVRESGALNESQLGAVEAIASDFQAQSEVINRQLADLQKKQELEDQQRMYERIKMMAQGGFNRGGFAQGGQDPRGRGGFGGPGGAGGEGQADPRVELMQQKSDLVSRTLDSIAALLSPEQLAAAPKPEANPSRERGEFGGRMTDEQRREMRERFQRERDGN
ncbi:MAG: hypothetical protein IT430_12365 [Phycisphaerales bacterium]|nr:hypothetical protein [Phycisphaerales bacterium]